MNVSKIEARVKGVAPGLPRHRYPVFSMENKKYRRIYPEINQGLPPQQIELEWCGREFKARLGDDGERLYYEFSTRSGWEPTPNNPEHDELTSLIQDFSEPSRQGEQ